MVELGSIRSLLAGERVDDLLLPPVKLSAGGAEYFGEEAITHFFRQSPHKLSSAAEVLRAKGHFALFDEDRALFASLYEDRIARLWHLSPGPASSSEPIIGVPFDTDLRQARQHVAFRAEDHPALSNAGADAVQRIGQDLAYGRLGGTRSASSYRVRPFAIQAFTMDKLGAVLFSTYRLGGAAERSAGFSFVAAKFDLDSGGHSSASIVLDMAGDRAVEQRPWRTSFA